MTDFDSRLRSDLDRIASQVPVSSGSRPPYVPRSDKEPVVRGRRAAFALSAVVLLAGCVALAATTLGGHSTEPGQTDSEASASSANAPDVTAPAEVEETGPKLEGEDGPGSQLSAEAIHVRDTPATQALTAHAQALLPGHTIEDAVEFSYEGETVSVIVDLRAPNGALAKLAYYNAPNPGHTEILRAPHPRISLSGGAGARGATTGSIWVGADETPNGGEVALILMTPRGEPIAEDQLSSLLGDRPATDVEAQLASIAETY